MTRKATENDIIPVAELYEEMLCHEERTVKYTSWRRGVYPTVATAKKAFDLESLYVFEENGEILGSVILDKLQPPEYLNIKWETDASAEQALVIHTLCVKPEYAGSGIGSAMVKFAKELALALGCITVRLGTSDTNTPAMHLYEKNGFRVIASSPILLDGQIECGKHIFMECKLA